MLHCLNLRPIIPKMQRLVMIKVASQTTQNQSYQSWVNANSQMPKSLLESTRTSRSMKQWLPKSDRVRRLVIQKVS